VIGKRHDSFRCTFDEKKFISEDGWIRN